jgi:hypothetical protein
MGREYTRRFILGIGLGKMAAYRVAICNPFNLYA